MISLISKTSKMFSKVHDFSFTTKFQQRVNVHENVLLCIQNVTVYGRNFNDEIIGFVDRYISSYS